MEERIPIHPLHGTVSSGGEPDGCATCSERTTSICGCRVRRWCILISLLVLVTIGLAVPMGIYAIRLGEATSCRLTYADDAAISESEMQSWMAGGEWPLSVPTYDPWRRTCVCKGFEDKDPKSLVPTDEVLAWIAPGDLASLSDDSAITPALPTSFLEKYRGVYSEKDHVKVCLKQQLVLDLWNINSTTFNAADGARHCHVSSSVDSSNVEQFFLGWDGALYCTDSFVNLDICRGVSAFGQVTTTLEKKGLAKFSIDRIDQFACFETVSPCPDKAGGYVRCEELATYMGWPAYSYESYLAENSGGNCIWKCRLTPIYQLPSSISQDDVCGYQSAQCDSSYGIQVSDSGLYSAHMNINSWCWISSSKENTDNGMIGEVTFTVSTSGQVTYYYQQSWSDFTRDFTLRSAKVKCGNQYAFMFNCTTGNSAGEYRIVCALS